MIKELICPVYLKTVSGTDYEGMLLPMLAKELKVSWLYKHFIEGKAALQPKLDGVRFIYTGISNHSCGKFHSRKGKPVATILSSLRSQIQDAFKDIPCDGELYSGLLHNKNTDYGFRDIISQVRSQDSDIYSDDGRVEYHVYDLPIPKMPFSERIEKAKEIISKLPSDSRIKLVPTQFIDFTKIIKPLSFSDTKDKILRVEEENIQDIKAMSTLNIFEKQGYEGTMVRRPNSLYLFGGLSPSGKNAGHPSGSKGRSYELLKAKTFFDVDAKVIGLEPGEAGNRNENRLGSVICEFKNKDNKIIKCKCGSGFSDEMRNLFWKNPNSIVGKIITIKFQEYTPDGVPRFPVFIEIRDYE